MSTVLDPTIITFFYQGQRYSTNNGANRRLSRTRSSSVSFNMQSRHYRILDWKAGQPIVFGSMIKSVNDLLYDPKTGNITHLPSRKVVLQLRPGLNALSVQAAIRIQ